MILKEKDDYLIRLGEVAEVVLGTEEMRYEVRANGEAAIGLGVIKQSKANELEIAEGIYIELERIKPALPEQIHMWVAYDKSRFVDASINEVFHALGIALCLVVGVIFLFFAELTCNFDPSYCNPCILDRIFYGGCGHGIFSKCVDLVGLCACSGPRCR